MSTAGSIRNRVPSGMAFGSASAPSVRWAGQDQHSRRALATGPVGMLRPRLSLAVVRPIWRFGAGFQAAQLAMIGRDDGVNLVTAGVAGLAVLGVWSLAYRLLRAVLLLFQALWRVSYPAMAGLLRAGDAPPRRCCRAAWR